jgi:membrane-associated phospholipid phosphatase
MPHTGHLMHWVSNFGDALVLLPASLGLVVLLFGFGLRRDAGAYLAALGACVIGVLAAKFAFAACDNVVFGIESPSGHSAFASTFYGSLAALFGAGRSRRRRVALYGGAIALILLIGVSRVATNAHTVADVIVGFAIGAIAVALFVGLRRAAPERFHISPQTIVRLSPFAALLALCWLLFAGHWVAEPYIDRAAERLGARLHLCE